MPYETQAHLTGPERARKPGESKQEPVQEPPSAEPVVVQASSTEQSAKACSQQSSQGTRPTKAILELFAGSARLTSAILQQGAMAYGVDHVRYKHAVGPVLELDLAKPTHQQLVMQWLSTGKVAAVHLGPPCGTASRAARVAAANVLYQFSADVINFCLQHDMPFAIENPSSSLFWLTSFWEQVPTDNLTVVDFQACAFGGKRPKWTRIVSNMAAMPSLCRLCPGCQDHAPWGRNQDGSWATASEAAYPHGLATALAQVFLQRLQEMSVNVTSHAASNQATGTNSADGRGNRAACPRVEGHCLRSRRCRCSSSIDTG